jgi:hypothetical protein
MSDVRNTRATRPYTNADIPRALRHLDTDQQWAERDLNSKAFATATEAAHRLRGLANVLYGIGISTEHRREEMSFLGAAAKDIALALERVNKAIWNSWEERDAKHAAKSDAKTKKTKRRRKAHGRRAGA